jgi:hypothetical protein
MTPLSFRHRGTRGLRRAAIAAVAALGALGACSNDNTSPTKTPPTNIAALTDLSRTATVGSAIAGAIVVKVTDVAGHPVENAAVALAVTLGNGSTNPRVALTDAAGQATAAWTLGTIAGPNEVTASVSGLAAQVQFEATGTAGAVDSIAMTPLSARLVVGTDTTRVVAQSLDLFGNVATPAPTLVARDPTLLSVDSTGLIHALRRGAGTYVVATAGGKSDSALVTVLATGQSICTAVATPMSLSVGQVVLDPPAQGTCIHGSADSAVYAIIPYYNSGVPSATTQLQILGQGVVPIPLTASSIRATTMSAAPAPSTLLPPDEQFESRLRARERANGPPLLAAARAWYARQRAARAATLGARAATTATLPSVGDLIQYNVNSTDFCDNPDYRTGRVAAITNSTIIVADTANPPGGFTDAEYQSIGVTFDTLVNPTDTTNFGAPSDIDHNSRVIMFFTRAVNELTSEGSSSIVLGFYYQRDLYPKTGSPGPCAGSNQAEMFYMLVPDTGGVVNGVKLSKSAVITYTDGTAAHEYQHLINASRRMYVNGVGTNFEVRWLDEGLAHSAEELNFHAAADAATRTNLGASVYANPVLDSAFQTYQNNNFQRYATYLATTESQAPVGVDDTDDDLPTRGAIWSYLRYLADHLPAGTEQQFWHALVNSNTSGIANLTNVLGTPPYASMRLWAISVYMDDHAPNVDPTYQQLSWNARSVLGGPEGGGLFPLTTHDLNNGATRSVAIAGGGVSFLRFSVPNGQDALLTVTSGGAPVPSTIQLAVVRVQ